MLGGVIAAVVVVVVGGLLGGALGGPVGLAVVAAVGLGFGAAFGWAVAVSRSYDLRSARGALLFVVDHTWSLLNTLAGATFLVLNVAAGNRVDRALGRHTGCVMLSRGFLRGFATTIGTVQAGTTPRIRRHEDTHVLQARLFGPLYLPLVVAHYVVATLVPYWLVHHDRVGRPIDSVGAYFLRGVYPNVWHEKWAYAVEGSPP